MISRSGEWPVPIILEAGVNHEGSLQNAFLMIDQAASLGVYSIKFQTYSAERLAAVNSPSYWDLSKESTTSQFELFKRYGVFTSAEYLEIASYCQQKSITFATTFFDVEWMDKLEHLVKFYKIASADLTNRFLLKRALEGNKPILLSTGASTIGEIEEVLQFAYNLDADADICLLHCVLNYPTHVSNANLKRIEVLRANFPTLQVGYSDHTVPPDSLNVIAAAYSLGANIIETHFTFDKTLAGNDHYHSLDYRDVSNLKNLLKQTQEMLEFEETKFISTQLSARLHARRGIYADRTIIAGSLISEQDLQFLRPIAEGGFPAEQMDRVVGKLSKRTISSGSAIQASDLYED